MRHMDLLWKHCMLCITKPNLTQYCFDYGSKYPSNSVMRHDTRRATLKLLDQMYIPITYVGVLETDGRFLAFVDCIHTS